LPQDNKLEILSLLDENAERFLQKSYLLFANLYLPPSKEQYEYLTRRKTTSLQEKHHVVPLAPSTSRFALLPIPMPQIPSKLNSRTSVAISGRNSRIRPSANLNLKPMKKSSSDVPLGISHTQINPSSSTANRVQGLMTAMAQKTSTSDLFSNATSYFSGVWGAGTPKGSPKRGSKS
jgi:hypothetical protein